MQATSQAPIETILGAGTGYIRKQNGIYLQNVLIEGADPYTFTVLSFPNMHGDSGYAKDKDSIYFGITRIYKADPNTFSVLNGADFEGGPDAFAKDKNNAYFDSFPISGADPTTFTSFGSLQQCGQTCRFDAQDKNHKYLQWKIVQPTLTCVSTYTWLPLSSSGYNSAYETDGDTVYFVSGSNKRIVDGADSATFLESWLDGSRYELFIPYAKDKAHVYYQNNPIAGANPATFAIPIDGACNTLAPQADAVSVNLSASEIR